MQRGLGIRIKVILILILILRIRIQALRQAVSLPKLQFLL